MPNVNLHEFASGALQEQFDREFQIVAANIYDPNTKVRYKREINIKMTLETNEDRDDVTTSIQTSSKLAPMKPIETHLFIGRDPKTSRMIAAEFSKGQMIGQLEVNDITDETKDDTTVVDFQKKTN